jgi:hypothetical protein
MCQYAKTVPSVVLIAIVSGRCGSQTALPDTDA